MRIIILYDIQFNEKKKKLLISSGKKNDYSHVIVTNRPICYFFRLTQGHNFPKKRVTCESIIGAGFTFSANKNPKFVSWKFSNTRIHNGIFIVIPQR